MKNQGVESKVLKKNMASKFMVIQGVHCDMLESKCIFWAENIFSQA